MNPDNKGFVNSNHALDEGPWSPLAHVSTELDESHRSHASPLVTTSVRSTSAASPSSLNPSSVTRPTSYNTGYPIYGSQHEGKGHATYAPSLSATYGSGSEEDTEHDDLHSTLFGMGEWSSSHQAHGQCLRERENAKPRLSQTLPCRLKKFPIVLHQYNPGAGSLPHDIAPPVTASTPVVEGPRCLLRCIPRQHCVVFNMICLMVFTVALSSLTVYSTDKASVESRKRTVIVSTMIMSIETVVMMLLVRRSLLEATVLSLFPLIFGLMFMLHLDSSA